MSLFCYRVYCRVKCVRYAPDRNIIRTCIWCKPSPLIAFKKSLHCEAVGARRRGTHKRHTSCCLTNSNHSFMTSFVYNRGELGTKRPEWKYVIQLHERPRSTTQSPPSLRRPPTPVVAHPNANTHFIFDSHRRPCANKSTPSATAHPAPVRAFPS